MITCAKCGTRVGVIGPCPTCKRQARKSPAPQPTNQTERGQVAGWNTPHPGMACYCYKDANCGCPNPVEPITHDTRCNRQHENDDHCNTLLPAPQPATDETETGCKVGCMCEACWPTQPATETHECWTCGRGSIEAYPTTDPAWHRQRNHDVRPVRREVSK